MKIRCVLFDLDGTLCDCTDVHYVALNKALKAVVDDEIGKEEHINFFNGLPTNKKLDRLFLEGRIAEEDKKKIWSLKQEYTKETVSELLHFDPVKVEVLKYLQSFDIRIACITNSIKETATLMLERTGQFEYMDLLIANDMIKNPKPHPEGFIRAMIHFQIMPEQVLIVEDSPVGLQAANNTGANVWKIDGVGDLTLKNILGYLD